MSCVDQPNSIQVFRSQLPLSSKFYSSAPPNYELLDASNQVLKSDAAASLRAILEDEGKWEEVIKINKGLRTLDPEYLIEFETESEEVSKLMADEEEEAGEELEEEMSKE